MAMGAVRGWVIHYIYGSLSKYRSSRMCVCLCVNARNASNFRMSGCSSRMTAVFATRIDDNKQDEEKVGKKKRVQEKPRMIVYNLPN